MRGTLGAVMVLALSGLYVAPAAAPQQGQALPGPGTGVVTVQGQVGVTSLPPVEQRGEWRVAIVNDAAVHVTSAAPVVVAAPSFLEQGATYLIGWPEGGQPQRLTVRQLGGGSWVLAGEDGGGTWHNLATARSIQKIR